MTLVLLTVWGFAALVASSNSYPPEQCQSQKLLQRSKSFQHFQRSSLESSGTSSTSFKVKDIIDQVDLCLANWVSGASNDSSKLALLSKIRVAEIYKVLETQGIAFSELPSSWPNHSTAEVNAIIMTGEEAAVTLVSHEFEEEVELWLHHFNSTNPSQLRHLVESVAVYLRMCGDDKDVEEFTRKVEEFASMGTWNQTDAETMAFLLNYVENQCQLETVDLDILVKETGFKNSNHSCSHTLQLAMTNVHQARTKRSLRIEKLPDGSVYASSLHRDGYCSSHFKLVEKQPDHWISKSQELGAFVDCFCVAKRHERDCRRDHAVGLQLVQKQVHGVVQRFEGALQNLDAAEVLTNLSKATASAKGTPLGPCDTPVECEVCLGAICFTTDPSVWKPGKTMKRMGNTDDIFEKIGTGLGDPSTCMSAACAACMALKPGDPIQFKLEIGMAGESCASGTDFMASFKIYISPQICMGGPLGEIAGLLGLDCIELGEVAYYPFLNMLTIQLNSPPVPPLPLPMVRVHTELSLILGDLVDAVKDHCNRHPEGSADQWNCLSTFYEARGNNQLTLKVEIGANLIFGSVWITAAKKTFVISEDSTDGFCKKHSGHACSDSSQLFQLLDCDGDGKVDPYCTNIWNDASYISSKDGCKEVHERCPAAALDQCAVRSDYCTEWHETLEYKDCDGDAYLDPVCTNSVNDGISIYRSAELCERTDYVQCVKPIFLPLEQGSRPCNELGAKSLTASQCEIVAKMEEFSWQGQHTWQNVQEGCVAFGNFLYYNKATGGSANFFYTPWCRMTFYKRDSVCKNQLSNSECMAAAAHLSTTYKGTSNWLSSETACIWTNQGVYFNVDGDGAKPSLRASYYQHYGGQMVCRINDFVWVQRSLVADEGNHLASGGYANIGECKALCLETAGCNSFATCESDPKGCWMKDKHLSASSASSSNQHAIDTRGCKSWYKEENDPWTKRSLVADEGNHLASGDYTTIEGCKALCLETAGCKSFATCESGPKGCWMKDKQLSASDTTNTDWGATVTRNCKSWYK